MKIFYKEIIYMDIFKFQQIKLMIFYKIFINLNRNKNQLIKWFNLYNQKKLKKNKIIKNKKMKKKTKYLIMKKLKKLKKLIFKLKNKKI